MDCTRCKQPIDGTFQPYHRTRRGPHHAVCPPQPSEAEIQGTCTGLLALDGWRPWRTDPCSDRGRGTGFGEKGMADHLYLRPYDASPGGDIMWIEWKKKTGRTAAHQRVWHDVERARGFLTLIAGIDFAASVDGFWHWYCRSGLKRKDLRL